MENSQNKQYICPMKCEGAKVYEELRNCPACELQLVPIEENSEYSGHGK
jgi:Cu2+-exporting ATPase